MKFSKSTKCSVSPYNLILLILFLLSTTNSLMIVLEKNIEYCADKEINSGDSIKASYMITGKKQDQVKVTLKGPHSMDYYTNVIENESIFKSSDDINLSIEYSGNYSLCFLTKKSSNTVVSFEYYTLNESGHLISLAKDEKFDEMYKDITVVSTLFEEIERNLKFYSQRKEIHSKIISEVVDLIQKLAVYKIGIILILSFIQVFIIQKFFTNCEKVTTRGKYQASIITENNIYL
jgi:hypothetical protein